MKCDRKDCPNDATAIPCVEFSVHDHHEPGRIFIASPTCDAHHQPREFWLTDDLWDLILHATRAAHRVAPKRERTRIYYVPLSDPRAVDFMLSIEHGRRARNAEMN